MKPGFFEEVPSRSSLRIQVLKRTKGKCVFLHIIYEWFSEPRSRFGSDVGNSSSVFSSPRLFSICFSWRLFWSFDTCSVEPIYSVLCLQPHSSAIQMFNSCHEDEQVGFAPCGFFQQFYDPVSRSRQVRVFRVPSFFVVCVCVHTLENSGGRCLWV